MTKCSRFQVNGHTEVSRPEDRARVNAVVAAVGAGQSIGGDSISGEQWVFCRSSGSTGASKVIRRSAASWIASFEVNSGLFGFSSADRIALLGSLDHSLTLYALLEGLHLGLDVRVLHGLRPAAQVLELQGATVLYATPAQLRLLLTVKDAETLDLRLILVGGGKLDAACRDGLSRIAPNAEVREFFGASETSFVTLSDDATPEGSVGRAYPGVSIDIREGELWVKSPYLFDGYEGFDDVVVWDEGFLSIGEMAEIDGDGYLTLLGRKDRMVTVADQNVYPEAIEAALLADPEVRHAAVLSRPDDLRGHRLIAVVEGFVANDTLLRLRKDFGALIAPNQVVEIDEMPLLSAGKPDLQYLTRWLERK